MDAIRPVDHSESGETVLLPCPGDARSCPLCQAARPARLVARSQGRALPAPPQGAHLAELRESVEAVARRFRAPLRSRSVSVYVDGIALDRYRMFEEGGSPRRLQTTFAGPRAGARARAVVAQLTAEQERVCRALARDEAARERFEAIATALAELEDPSR